LSASAIAIKKFFSVRKIIALDFRYGIQPKMLFIGGEFSCASRMFVAIFP
jgi:hypothetical protein